MRKLKVMIVEDESLERMLLKRFLEAEDNTYELVKEASFALEALEYLDEHTVDIVITDINMPVMDGLTMAQRILKMDPNVQVIVITGYNDFDHAQQAIKIGIADYLVKPVDAKEFSAILLRVREKITSRQGGEISSTEIERQIANSMPSLCDRFLNELMTKEMDREVLQNKLAFFKLQLTGNFFRVGIISLLHNGSDMMQQLFTLFSIRNTAMETVKPVHAFLQPGNQLVLLCAYHEDHPGDFDQLKRVLDSTLDVPCAIGVGMKAEGIDNIRYSYAQAVRAVNCHSLLDTHHVIYYQDLGVVEDKPAFAEPMQMDMAELEQIAFFLRSGMNANVQAWLDQHFQRADDSIEHARLKGVMVISSLYAMRVEPFMNLKERIAQMLDLFTAADIREFLMKLMGDATNTLDSIRTNTVSKQIQTIVDYIQEHLSDSSLSLHDTSQYFFFNASYLSRIFKQNTGMSFREYVNKQRIDLARKYLDDPDAKAYEVGIRVGIDDPNYFSTLFKKYAGMTVKQYRASAENG